MEEPDDGDLVQGLGHDAPPAQLVAQGEQRQGQRPEEERGGEVVPEPDGVSAQQKMEYGGEDGQGAQPLQADGNNYAGDAV